MLLTCSLKSSSFKILCIPLIGSQGLLSAYVHFPAYFTCARTHARTHTHTHSLFRSCTYSYEWTNLKHSTDMDMWHAGWRAHAASTRASGRTSCAWRPPVASRGSCTRSCGLYSRPDFLLLRPLRAPLVLLRLRLRLRRPRTATRRTRYLPPIRRPAHRSPPVLLLLRALRTPTWRRWLMQSRRDNSHDIPNRWFSWVSCEIVNSFAHYRSFAAALRYVFGVQYFYRVVLYAAMYEYEYRMYVCVSIYSILNGLFFHSICRSVYPTARCNASVQLFTLSNIEFDLSKLWVCV